jgi:hypothetical protein
MNKTAIIFIGLLSSLLVSINVTAADVTAKTNIEGVVIKKFYCAAEAYWGNIVNRTNQSLEAKTVYIKAFDSDGDPIGSCKKKISLGPKSGSKFIAHGCNCTDAIFYQIVVQ